MAADGQIVFEITADGRKAIASVKDVTSAIQRESGKWQGSASSGTGGIEKAFGDMFKKVAAGFSAAAIGKKLLDIGSAAIQAASDLQEVQNVVDVTFGNNAGKIEKWAKNAGTQFGLTETQAKRFTSTLGAMMKSAGMSGDAVADMSTDMAGLAADMASFYNLDFDTAFQKIRSGLSGETEPLKQLGINMSVANLEAYALKKGINKTFSEMSQGEQIMLRYQYMMQATADAQGDFARTSDGYANATRKLETNLENLKTSLGSTFINVVADAVGALNGFIELLTPDESKKTVLDDFADIDLKTEEKLEGIRKTATEANLLVSQLDAIGGSHADKAGSKVQQMVNGLSSIDLSQGNAGIIKDFVSTLATDIGTLADLQGTDAQGAKEWLEGIAASADSLDPEDAAGWVALLDKIKEGLPGIENTEFGAAFFGALGGGFGDVEKQASTLEWAVETLGKKTNKTAEEQALWLETCKRLVKTIPGLSSIINVETGEIKGGTDAVKEYIKAWEDGQVKLAMLGALEQKESALSSRFADLPGLQLDMMVAEKKLRDRNKKIQALMHKYGLDEAYANFLRQGDTGLAESALSVSGATDEDLEEMGRLSDGYDELVSDVDKTTAAYKLQADALEEAKAAIEEYRQTVDEMPGEYEEAGEAAVEWSEEAKTAAKDAVDALQTALTALNEYVQGVRDATKASIDGTVKGFGEFKTAAQRYDEQITALEDEFKELKKNGKIKGSIDFTTYANGKTTTIGTMTQSLQAQLDYLKEYQENLAKVKAMGASDAVLASLSDGSTESADYLAALARTGDEESIKKLNELYAQVDAEKEGLTDVLTQQKLAADEQYDALVQKAKESVEALNLGDAATTAMGDTVAGIAQGIADHVPDVKEQVDAVLAELNRLNTFNLDFNLDALLSGSGESGGNDSGDGTEAQPATPHSLAIGMDYVPFDHYLAALHEGESVLTAEEAKVWRAFKNGGASSGNVDYDTLGGVMRDNVQAGGDVYLDRRIVGQVISQNQASSYRSLKRSGWQQ